MATRTSGNIGLVKPEYSDIADVGIINTNMDIIDDVVSDIQDWQPTGDGTNDQILRSNGDGTTRWDNAATEEEIGDAVTDWLEDHVDPDTGYVIDDTLTVSDAAADAAATGAIVAVGENQPTATTNKLWINSGSVSEVQVPTMDEFSDLNSALNSIEAVPATDIFVSKGSFMATTWKDINTNYQHIAFPIAGGDIVSLKCSGASVYAVAKSYQKPAFGDTVDYSAATGFTTYISLSNSGTSFTAPSDAAYLLVMVVASGNDRHLTRLEINDYNFLKSVSENIVELKNEFGNYASSGDLVAEATERENGDGYLKNIINSLEAVPASNLFISNGDFSGSTWEHVNSNYKHIAFPISSGDTIFVKCSGASFYAVVKSYQKPTLGDTIDFSNATGFTTYMTLQNTGTNFTAPSDAAYLLVMVVASGVDRHLTQLEINGYNFLKSVSENIVKLQGDIGELGKITTPLITDFVWSVGYYNLTDGTIKTNAYHKTEKVKGNQYNFFYDTVFYGSSNNFISFWYQGVYVGYMYSNNKYYNPSGQEVEGITYDEWAVNIFTGLYENLKPNSIEERLEQLESQGTNSRYQHLNGLKIGFLGDSITAGVGASDYAQATGSPEKCYVSLMKNEFGENVVNYGINGSLIASSASGGISPHAMSTRYSNMTNNLDVVVIFGGTNDARYGTAWGTIDSNDTDTFLGALNVLMSGLVKKYCGKEIFFVTPMSSVYGGKNSDDANTDTGKTLLDYRNAIIERATYHGIPVIDLYSMCGMDVAHNTANKTYYSSDGLHPNDAGHKRVHDRIVTFISNILY